jgi:archaellum biogenesis protein FlaJ (TadC family)
MDFEYILIIVQIILGLNFLFMGFMKLTAPFDKLVKLIGWPEDYNMKIVKFFGVFEMLGALGVLLPLIVEGTNFVVPLAATGLGFIMAGSMWVHLRREDTKKMAMGLLFFFLAVIAGFGRLVELSF